MYGNETCENIGYGASQNSAGNYGKVASTAPNLKENETEVKQELMSLEKNLGVLMSAIDTLEHRTSSATRPMGESDMGATPRVSRASELGLTLQNVNDAIQRQTSRIFSVNDRIEL